MSVPLLFLLAVSAWVMAWGLFLGSAWCTTHAADPHPMSLLDDHIHFPDSKETNQ